MTDGDGHFLKLFNKKDVPQGFTKSSSLTLALQTYQCSGKSGEAGTLELMAVLQRRNILTGGFSGLSVSSTLIS
jgi:hypothetical protein